MATITLPAAGSTNSGDIALDITYQGGGTGVAGKSTGVSAFQQPGVGVHGVADHGGVGVLGSTSGSHITITLKPGTPPRLGRAVYGVATDGNFGVVGESDTGIGVAGKGDHGIHGEGVTAGVFASNPANATAAMLATKALAGDFEGSVRVSGGILVTSDPNATLPAQHGDLKVTGSIEVGGDVVLPNADCAEEFDVSPDVSVTAGMVVILGPKGAVMPCASAYAKTVLGVVSGAGAFRPAIILDRRPGAPGRVPIALIGKAECLADADHGAIEPGDLLTTSPTEGHAMKANDPLRAVGTTIGKALGGLAGGRGSIPVLVMLR